MPSSTVSQNPNKPPTAESASPLRTEASSTNATSGTNGTTTPRYVPATAQPQINAFPAQHQVNGARRDEFLRGIGAWTEARSPEAKTANATAAAAAGTRLYENQPRGSHAPAQIPQASANRHGERSLLPMERFRKESEREEPFGGKKD